MNKKHMVVILILCVLIAACSAPPPEEKIEIRLDELVLGEIPCEAQPGLTSDDLMQYLEYDPAAPPESKYSFLPDEEQPIRLTVKIKDMITEADLNGEHYKVGITYYLLTENNSDQAIIIGSPGSSEDYPPLSLIVTLFDSSDTSTLASMFDAGNLEPRLDDYVRIPAGETHCREYQLGEYVQTGPLSFSVIYGWHSPYFAEDGVAYEIDAWGGSIRSNMIQFELP